MASNLPFVLHQPKHVHPEDPHSRVSRVPVIPDLRFEHSYLRTIRPYVHLRRDSTGDDGDSTAHSVVEVQWGRVLWITLRDQLVSPLVQGAVWALAQYFFSPFFAQFGSGVRTYVSSHLPTTEGLGITWLRDQVQNLRLVDARSAMKSVP